MHLGDPLRMLVETLLKGFPQQQQVGNLSEDLTMLSPYFSVRSNSKITTSFEIKMCKSSKNKISLLYMLLLCGTTNEWLQYLNLRCLASFHAKKH